MIKTIIFGLGLAIGLLASPDSFATTTISGVSGASNFDFTTSATNPKIYGGFIKNANTCAKDNVRTCDTCDGVCATGTMCACNQTAIYTSLAMTANFSSSIDLGGRMILYQRSTDSTPTAFTGTNAPAGTTSFTISKNWSFWCGLTALSADCGASGTLDGGSVSVIVGPSKVGSSTLFEDAEKITLEIKVSVADRTAVAATAFFTPCPSAEGTVSSQGICYYKIVRGDGKVYIDIEDYQVSPDFPIAAASASDLNYSSLLFFYGKTTNPTTIRNNSDAAELPLDTSGSSFSFDDRITDLENDVKYCFILGNMDKANNVRTFQDPAAAAATTAEKARVCATPSLVQGLLDDKKCFIATAAFGSSMDPHVDILRQFRAKFLMPTTWGTKFVKFYYNHSSVWAQKIRHSETARTIVRGFLWPVVGFATLSVDLGLPSALGIFTSVLMILALLIFYREKYFRKIKSKVFAKLGFLILFGLFSFSLFLPAVARAQDFEPADMSAPANQDFEAGSAPAEPPYVDSGSEFEDLETGSEKAAAPVTPLQEKDSAKALEEIRKADSDALTDSDLNLDLDFPTKNKATTAVNSPAAAAQAAGVYRVPKFPQTQEGRESGHEKIPHPMAREGLLSIEKDGSYYYEPMKFEIKNESISFRAGGVQPSPNITGPDGHTNFDAMYGGTPVELNVDYEWYPFVGWGKLGLQGGVGFFTSTGSGRFTYASNSNATCNNLVEDCTAREKYTFYGVPVSLGLIYRLQLSDRPYFAPYAVGGGSYYFLAEKRDDGKPIKGVGSSAAYGGGGVMVNISAFDRTTAFTLENEYGLHNVWVHADYRYIASLSKVLDVSASLISLGIVMDY